MSLANKFASLQRKLPTGTAQSGLKGFLTDKGERYAAAYGFGFAKTYFGDRFLIAGHGADLWLGALATLLSTFAPAKYAPHLERVGDAGMMSALNSLGAAMGVEKSGKQVVVKQGKKTVTAGDAIGMIPPAMGGTELTADAIQRFAQRR